MKENPKTAEQAFEDLRIAWHELLKETGIYKMVAWIAQLLDRRVE